MRINFLGDKLEFFRSKIPNFGIPLMSAFLLILALVVAIVLMQKTQLLKTKASGENSSIDLAIGTNNTINVALNQTFDVPVMINTDSSEIVAADIVVSFDKNYLELIDIQKKADGTSLTKFLPRDSADNFDKAKVLQVAKNSGTIDFGAVAYSGNKNPLGFSGVLGPSNPLSFLKFKALKNGSTLVNVQSTGGSSNDSNLVSRTSQDVLGKVTNLNILIGQDAPAPTLPGTVSINLDSIDDGYSINSWGNNQTAPNLRAGSNNYDAGFRFNLPLPVGAEILSAKLSVPLEMTSDNAGAIANIKAEKGLNSVPLSESSTFIAKRNYFENSINWPLPNNQWSVYVDSPDIKNLIQDIINQPGWSSGNSILLSLIKTADTHYANINSLESSPAKPSKLTITYRIPPTPTPSPTPRPAGNNITLTTVDDGYSINSWGHNETNPNVRIGGSYDAGFRFALPVPKGKQITNASLKVFLSYTQDAQQVPVKIKVEQSVNAQALGGSNSFVPARKYFDSSVSWNMVGNSSEITSPELKNLIQEVVNQNNWQAGNNILIALLKENDKYADLISKEGDLQRAAKLIITYK